MRDALSQQTPAEQLSATPPFPDLLLINRLLWLGLSGGLLVRAADRLTFQHWASRESNKTKGDVSGNGVPEAITFSLPTIHREFARRASWQLLRQLTRSDFRFVVRQPAFPIVALLLVLAILGYATGLGNLNEAGQRLLPFTSRMTYIRLPLLLFIGLFLTVFSGELLHRDRSSGMWQLVDATPPPAWVLLMAKYGAMLGVASLLTGTLFLAGLSVQVLNGQTPINWSLYATDLLADGLLRYAQLIALTFLVQAIIPHRLAGQLVSAGVLVLLLAFDKTGLTGSWLALYSSLPNAWSFSELTGYGTAEGIRWVYSAMWSVAGLGFLLLATKLGQRGVVVPIGIIGRRWRSALQPGYVVWLFAVVSGLIISQLYLRFPENQLTKRSSTVTPSPILYRQTSQVVPVAERPLVVHYQYVHEQNLPRLQAIVRQTITAGSSWLGTFPLAELTLVEVPFYQSTGSSLPGRIEISEWDGWLTDTSHPDEAGQVDISIARTLLRHWVRQKTTGNVFINQCLPDYLALRIVQQTRGDAWLASELARLQRASRKMENRGNVPGQTPDLLVARGPLSLTCLGEVWGHEQLCRAVGQFVQTGEKAASASFDQALTNALPDSLTYLTTYLHHSLTFDFRIGQIGLYPDRISVQVRAHKYGPDSLGQPNEQLLNDYVPVVLLNKAGQVIYRQLILANTDDRTDKADWLPAHPDAVAVAIDPLGTWPERNKHDNQKRLART